MVWLKCYGTYQRQGPFNDVYMGGTPDTSINGLDLSKAKSKNFGNGIQFTSLNNEGTSVNIKINLVGYSVDTSHKVVLNSKYVYVSNETYDWYVDYYYSTDSGGTYVGKQTQLLAQHNSTQSLAYANGWELSTINKEYTISLPSNFTHLKVEVRGFSPAERYQNIYTREQVIPPPPPPQEFRPWAIRKSNTFKSLETLEKNFMIRNSSQWVDKSKMNPNESNQENKGTSQIRKNNKWVGQSKIGE